MTGHLFSEQGNMMRKAMWCGAVLALLGAAGFYLGIDYARHHPGSAVGQCLIGGYEVGQACSPVGEVSEAAVESTYEAIREVMDHPGMVPTTVPVIPVEPAPCREACPKACPEGAPMLGKIVIQPEAEAPSAPAAGAAEEASEPPPMPPARDDEPVPPKMPYATDQVPEAERGLEFWWRLVQEAAAAQAVDATEEEECLPPPPATSDCREDPNYDHHYSGCPHMYPQGGKCPGCGKADPVTPAKAAPHKTEAGTEEQTVPPAMPKGGPQAKAAKPRTLDTTEYRPSDGNPFDFGSFPF
jgi:hypothetical protein